MALVKTEMGGEAVILHTRTLQRRRWLGLRRREIVEITAGVGLNVTARPVRRPAASDRRNSEDRGRAVETPARRPGPTPGRPSGAAAPAATQANPGKDFLETPAANRAMMMSISSEVRELRGVMEDLVKRAKRESAPQVPEKLFDYYTNLIQNQVADELATDMVRQLQAYRPEQLQQSGFVRDRLH